MNKNSILEGSIYKGIMNFFIPIVMGTFFLQLYTTIDAMIVGKYIGKEALAAISGNTQLLIKLLIGFFTGLTSGASVVVAQAFGAGNKDKTNRSINASLIMAICFGIFTTIVGLLIIDIVLVMFRTPLDIVQYSKDYLEIYFIGVMTLVIYNMAASILRALGDSKSPFYILLIGAVVNIFLDLLFVVVLKTEVKGAAWATIISQGISAVLAMLKLCKVVKIDLNILKVDKQTTKEVCTIGLPLGLQSLMFTLSNISIQIGINGLGTDSVAAWATMGKLDFIFWIIVEAFGIAITTFVGQNYGAKQYDRCRGSIKAGFVIGFSTLIVVCALLLIFGKNLFYLFISDEVVINLATKMMFFMFPFFIVYLPIEIYSGALKGVGKVVPSSILCLVSICLFRCIYMAFVIYFDGGLYSVMLAYPMSWFLGSFCFMVYCFNGRWLKKA